MNAATQRGGALAWSQLFRAANVFTAASNVIAGFLIVQRQWAPADALALLAAASACLYLAGMVLNDVFDAPLDSVERPERPIPSGRIARSSAAVVGWLLLLLGISLAWWAAWAAGHLLPGLIGSLLALAIVRYDMALKRTSLGPIGMGFCRFFNVTLGASVARNLWDHPAAVAYAALVGVYTIVLTQIARSESVGSLARQLGVRNLVTRLLQGFIVIDALAATAAAGWPSGLAVLALLIPTLIIARWADMT
jgi:4-hydroxybenzoate polyprenyltransferase